MGAFEKLPPSGRTACSELAKASPWSAEEWARSVRTLTRAGLFPAIGLTDVAALVLRTGVPPDDVAAELVRHALEEVRSRAEPGPDKPQG